MAQYIIVQLLAERTVLRTHTLLRVAQKLLCCTSEDGANAYEIIQCLGECVLKHA